MHILCLGDFCELSLTPFSTSHALHSVPSAGFLTIDGGSMLFIAADSSWCVFSSTAELYTVLCTELWDFLCSFPCSSAALVLNCLVQGFAVSSTWIPVGLAALSVSENLVRRDKTEKLLPCLYHCYCLEFNHFYFLVCICRSNLLPAKSFASCCANNTEICLHCLDWLHIWAIPHQITQK